MKTALLHSDDLLNNDNLNFFSDFYDSVESGLGKTSLTRMSLKSWYENKDSFDFDLIAMIGIHKPANLRGFYSGEVLKHQYKNNKKCLVMERGYLGNREKYWSVGFDGLNGRGNFNNDNMPSDRFDKLNIKLKEIYKADRTGENVLFCLQLPWDSAVSHLWYPEFVYDSIKKMLDVTKKNILLRHHPLYKERIKKAKKWKYKPRVVDSFNKAIDSFSKNPRVIISQEKSLQEELSRSHCLVTLNSNSAVDAMIEGVPSIVLDKGSMIYDVSHKSLFEIDTLHVGTTLHFREQKLYDIAYAQWDNEEISQGEPFKH